MGAYLDLKACDQIGGFSKGRDSKGNFKSAYLKKIVLFSKLELRQEIVKIVIRFFKTKKDPKSDYFWKNNALYHECLRRGCQKNIPTRI